MTPYSLLRPLIFRIPAEPAHRLTIKALSLSHAGGTKAPTPSLAQRVAGIAFPNPVGMAPGFDKNAEVPDAMLGLGFGFVEVGTVTPQPQEGNPKPRLFRLVEDRAVINRMGFNNEGAQAVANRLVRRREAGLRGLPGIVGVNIGANKDSVDRIADYAQMTRLMAPLASYLTVNISSPNTPGLRALQDEGALSALLDAVIEARGNINVPIFLKLAPDLEPSDIDGICRIALEKQLAALIVSNTTITRPALKSRHGIEAGGLSGEPLRELALQRLRDFRKASGGAIPLIGVGGIATVDDAWARIRAGASLIQIYSAMVYEGPGLASRIVAGLEKKVREAGMTSIAEAVGSE
ncbi:MAG: dihydroorotate dehydrogenase (quinone) [Novosphingobium sp. 17-62-19]|uniref:quinone-dependent dihydroorotate dehydrogenase n=1 Tax=Novosphingobium sp. 17-62-19 TaxID=1970406 RepID=UPI000BCF3BA6|nr:quinone-dependent dihydroorotate dehydrogenase [Novosphingobium sp. 17-62-19]OZA21096.1 MAG: dihydroorotate dehydrogenase (quinone) [Novosphingobium sp. 17-62-19]HQS95602.1 quinone-dependent dihydroorotate dehydrogenase [Novosphingobium sp.]